MSKSPPELEPLRLAAIEKAGDAGSLAAFRAALRQHPPDHALAALEQLPLQSPGLAADRGWLLVELGRLEEAIPFLDRAIAAGRDPSPFYFRAVIAAQREELGLAAELARRALELDPQLHAARALYAELLLSRDEDIPLAARVLSELPQQAEMPEDLRMGIGELALRAGLPGLAARLLDGLEDSSELMGLAELRLGRGEQARHTLGLGAPLQLSVAALWVAGHREQAMALVDASPPSAPLASWLEAVGAERRARVMWRRLGIPAQPLPQGEMVLGRPLLIAREALASVGEDERGAYLRVASDRRSGFPLPKPGWNLAGVDKGVTLWRPRSRGFGLPTNLTDDRPLRDWLERQAVTGTCPLMLRGLLSTLTESMPAESAVCLRLPDLCANLATRFGLTDDALRAQPQVRVLDPFAPHLMLVMESSLRPLPEMPLVELGPDLLNQAWWLVFSLLEHHALDRGALRVLRPMPEVTPLLEGLFYWTAVRLYGRLAALSGQSDTPALWALIDRIQDGSRALVGEP